MEARSIPAAAFTGQETLGDRIRRARRQLNLTQAQLAEQLGVSLHTVYSWETNRREPRAGHLRQIAELTSTPIAYWYELIR